MLGHQERVFVIPLRDLDSRQEVYKTAIESVDPDGSKYPIILRHLHYGLEQEDPSVVLAEARAMIGELHKMRFQLQRGDVLYTRVLVESPPLIASGSLADIILSPWEKYRIETSSVPGPVPIYSKFERYLNFLVRTGERLVG